MSWPTRFGCSRLTVQAATLAIKRPAAARPGPSARRVKLGAWHLPDPRPGAVTGLQSNAHGDSVTSDFGIVEVRIPSPAPIAQGLSVTRLATFRLRASRPVTAVVVVYCRPMPRAKIVCTLGPASSSPERIGELMDSGMSVVRLNFSHGTHEDHLKVLLAVRAESEKRARAVAVLLDLQGPKIRVGRFA
ncbi:MAG TPA: pyruvate kinase, partial [Kofleriaceae bacterium]|nr:pyruvate kinase [Kofleriaceae bacterium]